MRYLILIGHDEKGGKTLSEAEHRALFEGYQKYEIDLKRAGVLLGGEPLQPTASACRISSQGGQRRIVDGPFTESKEIWPKNSRKTRSSQPCASGQKRALHPIPAHG